MNTQLMSFRVDKNLRNRFADTAEAMGLDSSSLLRALMNKTVVDGRVELVRGEELSVDAINTVKEAQCEIDSGTILGVIDATDIDASLRALKQ